MSRGYTWIDDSIEHSDQDEARAAALAKKWSQLHDAEEQRQFRRQAEWEEGRSYEPDLEPCETCGGDRLLGVDGKRTRHGDLILQDWQFGVRCPSLTCEDGIDVSPRVEWEREERERKAERRLEIELIEDKLERLGARMMRPYEHWNEDERYMEYMENRY